MRNIGGNRDLAGNGVSWTPLEDLEGIITPSGLHFERHHNGVPEIDPAQHRLVIHGLVKQPLMFTVENLLRYPMQSHLIFHRMRRQQQRRLASGADPAAARLFPWPGVMQRMDRRAAGGVVRSSGHRSESNLGHRRRRRRRGDEVSLPLAKLMEDAIIALYQNGERIRPENGYPMRLVVPGWEGVVNVKWLRRLQLTTEPVMARNETVKIHRAAADRQSAPVHLCDGSEVADHLAVGWAEDARAGRL